MAKRNNTQIHTAYTTLRDRIIAYGLPPGAPVSDYQIAAELGMSRAPVREAILLLTADGLIESDEAGKSRVSDIGYPDVIDIMGVRRALEGEAIRMIAENGWLSDARLAELDRCQKAYAASTDVATILVNNRTDDDFHTMIVACAGNRRMLQMVERLNMQMLRARWVNVAVPQRQSQVPAEHQAIWDALAARDLARALKANKTHLDHSQLAYKQVYSDPAMRQVMAGLHSFLGGPAAPGDAPKE